MTEYIDRDAALDCFACDLGKKDYSVSYQGFMTEAAFRINDLPAADVRPVVRGEWKPVMRAGNPNIQDKDEWYGALFVCDKCNWTMIGESNFCPNCGAEMMEEN